VLTGTQRVVARRERVVTIGVVHASVGVTTELPVELGQQLGWMAADAVVTVVAAPLLQQHTVELGR